MSIKPDFLYQRQGKVFVLYPGLLDEAHTQGLKGIAVNLLQTPGPDNGETAICVASVTLTDDRIFIDIGDASPRNTNSTMSTALIRMASTRAKARALRDAINLGALLLDETDEIPDDKAGRQARPAERSRGDGRLGGAKQEFRETVVEAAPSGPPPAQAPPPTSARPPTSVTEGQMRAITALADRHRLTPEKALDEARAFVRSRHISGLSDLSHDEANGFIEVLKNWSPATARG